MSSRIFNADVNILNGTLLGRIEFTAGLNIVCGENGTLKTKLLQSLKNGQYNTENSTQPRIQAISPKRNSERRALDAAFQFMRQHNRTYDTFIGEAGGQQLNDQSFSNYPSLVELYIYIYERKCRDGGAAKEHMRVVESEFNSVIGSVFPEYQLVAEWNQQQGRPLIQIKKRGAVPIPIHELSLGEQEVLSLVANIYSSKDAHDTFLIDEPEVHLNWSLEEKLFEFLDDFCNTYDRQIIAVTHSRAVFLPRFMHKITFLVWNEQQRVVPSREISADQRRKIAGEAISVLRLGNAETSTVFVEDRAHEAVIKKIAQVMAADITITQCGPKSNVRSLYKRSLVEGGWPSSLFLEDGDGEGPPHFAGEKYLHLDKYCIENYLLDIPTISAMTGTNETTCQRQLFDCISKKRDVILGKNKFLEFLWPGIKADDVTPERLSTLDASLIISCFSETFGLSFDEYLDKYISMVFALGRESNVLPLRLIEWLRSTNN